MLAQPLGDLPHLPRRDPEGLPEIEEHHLLLEVKDAVDPGDRRGIGDGVATLLGVSNLGGEVDPGKLVPFLTCKHSLDYCLMYAARAASSGYPALTVLGGDLEVGTPRCVAHASELREKIRARVPGLALGGWANPHREPERQVDWLLEGFHGEFFLTQVVSHHDLPALERFLAEGRRRGVTLPGVFGVFYYRSASQKTLAQLAKFMPVPVEGLTREFARGDSPDEVCARTIRALREVGVDKVYLSNLGTREADRRLKQVLALV